MTRRAAAAPVSRDREQAQVPGPSLFAPAMSAIVLLVIGLFTVSLFTGRRPVTFSTSGGETPVSQPGDAGDPGKDPERTAAPSNVVVVPPDPRLEVPGSILYVKGGNIWLQTGTKTRQVTDAGRDSMPTWSSDGKWIYFVETVPDRGLFPSGGLARHYTLAYPVVTRVRPDGSEREAVLTGLYNSGPNNAWKWFTWLRQPVLSPDGKTIALLSDAPTPSRSDVVVQFYDLETKKLTRPNIPEELGLGHQDVAWRPDGKLLAYVRNGRDGARGTPRIFLFNPVSKRSVPLSGPGYSAPSWSPDGKYVAATRTTNLGTDVVILNGSTGSEVLRLTTDGRSWGPSWSPAGNAVAFLHLNYQIVDLRMVTLEGRAPNLKVGTLLDLTEYSGLDGESRPSWFVPADQLPKPTPTPTASRAAATARPSATP